LSSNEDFLEPVAGPSDISNENANHFESTPENVVFGWEELSKSVEYNDEPLFEWKEISRSPEIASRRYRR
jgi:formylmethanofuran dehydrogenase subunit E